MKYKPTILVSAAVLISLTVVGMLYVGSDKKQNYRYASFERNFILTAICLTDSLDLKYSGYYIAGYTGYTVYLSHPKNPSRLIAVSKALRDTTHYILRVDTDNLQYRAIRVAVDSPYFYMADGTQPFIYKGVLSGAKATAWITDIGFTKAIPLSDNSAALILIRNMENTLVKKVKGRREPKIYPDILEEQGEGIFSTDGMFLFDKPTSNLVYLYFYRNQYIVMDTSFASVTYGNTIDTIATAKIKIGKIESRRSVTMASPPLLVNKQAAISENKLYIHSNILAKNESIESFEESYVIDVYDLNSQTYVFSFYIPFFNEIKPKEFIVVGNMLTVLCDQFVICYKINFRGDDKERLRL